nr:hypothetical protein [Lichenihabitans psoromatis]
MPVGSEGAVEDGHLPRERLDLGEGQVAGDREVVQEMVLVEADHLDDGIDQRTVPIHGEASARPSRDAMGAAVEDRRSPSVQREFPFASSQAMGRRREVDIGQPHALL